MPNQLEETGPDRSANQFGDNACLSGYLTPDRNDSVNDRFRQDLGENFLQEVRGASRVLLPESSKNQPGDRTTEPSDLRPNASSAGLNPSVESLLGNFTLFDPAEASAPLGNTGIREANTVINSAELLKDLKAVDFMAQSLESDMTAAKPRRRGGRGRHKKEGGAPGTPSEPPRGGPPPACDSRGTMSGTGDYPGDRSEPPTRPHPDYPSPALGKEAIIDPSLAQPRKEELGQRSTGGKDNPLRSGLMSAADDSSSDGRRLFPWKEDNEISGLMADEALFQRPENYENLSQWEKNSDYNRRVLERINKGGLTEQQRKLLEATMFLGMRKPGPG